MSSKDHRKFYRADFKTNGYILKSEAEKMPFNLLNISLKGILVEMPESSLEMEETYDLRIKLVSTDIEIKTVSVLVHKEGEKLGFYFKEIDLDSMIHLRRLLELNTPNEGEIEKELAFLNNFH